MMAARNLRTPLTLAVLSLLVEKPSHPYEMKIAIEQRHVGDVVKMRGGSLYDTIRRLAEEGLVEEVGTDRAGARPERTVYRATKAGKQLMREILREYLGKPANDYPVFTTALAHVLGLPRDEVAELLAQRLELLGQEHAAVEESRDQIPADAPRVVFIEVEYAQAMRKAEMKWIRSILRDIENDTLEWM